MAIIGRKKELKELERIYDSEEPEFLAVYGRRRIGKTFLLHEFFQDKGFYFVLTGSQEASKKEQLKNFCLAFGSKTGVYPPALESWSDAFEYIRQEVETIQERKIILFFDELPWLSSKKSGFLGALEYYWNQYFSKNKRIIVIVCGSAASWMIKKVVYSKGGLHGRLTSEMRLAPFDLKEVEQFLVAKQIEFDRRQILELYMAMGGVAKYLTCVKRGKSAAQIIQELCFESTGYLYYEFHKLYKSLFTHHEKHIKIVEVLGKHKQGMTKEELLKQAGMTSGGGSTTILQELEESGFVIYMHDFGKKKKDGRYYLIDEFSLFYLTWMKDFLSMNALRRDYWLKMQDTASYLSWAGYAFEGICFTHLPKLVHGLGLDVVAAGAASWSYSPRQESDKGAQIDLVISRTDSCINLCEMKFTKDEFVIDKSYAENLLHKKNQFRKVTQTKKTLFTTLVTTYGAKENAPYFSSVDNQISIDVLFE